MEQRLSHPYRRSPSALDVNNLVNFGDNVECTGRDDCTRPAVIRAKTSCKNDVEYIVFYCSEHYKQLRDRMAACTPCYHTLGPNTLHLRIWVMDL